jgi:hypothetical protein
MKAYLRHPPSSADLRTPSVFPVVLSIERELRKKM